MRLPHQRGWKAPRMLGILYVAIALLWSSASKAETRVYLLRGWFGVFDNVRFLRGEPDHSEI